VYRSSNITSTFCSDFNGDSYILNRAYIKLLLLPATVIECEGGKLKEFNDERNRYINWRREYTEKYCIQAIRFYFENLRMSS
jgi:hypothetical protein